MSMAGKKRSYFETKFPREETTLTILDPRSDGWETFDWKNSVYIGSGFSDSRNLRELKPSKWENPFEQDDLHPSEVYESYKDYIRATPRLRTSLYKIVGKKLFCTCLDLGDTCHGHALVKLCEDIRQNQIESEVFVGAKNNSVGVGVLFFKGPRTPFSNLYVSPLKTRDGNEFVSALHLYAWKRALSVGQTRFAYQIKQRTNPVKIYRDFKKLLSRGKRRTRGWSVDEAIVELYRILETKLEQNKSFQRSCELRAGCLFVQAVASRFWGGGVSMHTIQNCEVDDISQNISLGLNVMGWILTYLVERYTNTKVQFNEETPLPGKIKLGRNIVRNALVNADIIGKEDPLRV